MYQYRGYIKRVVDGDTIVMDLDLGFYMWLHDVHLRLYGVDTPERGDEGFDEATEYVEKFFETRPDVVVSIYKQGKYGRWLVDIWDEENETTLNDQLIEKNLAVPYMI